jgi:hypothetical protein
VLTLGGRQFISGAINVHGERRSTFAMVGQFDATGHYRRVIKRGSEAPLTLDFQLAPQTRGISGTVASSDRNETPFTSTFNASPRTRANTFAGTFTMLVEPPPGPSSGPSYGVGFATVKIGPSGDVRATGTLPDGTRFSSGTFLHARDFTVYASLYASGLAPRGSLSGRLMRASGPLRKATGPLRWLKPPRPADAFFPAGIDLTTHATAISYKLPLLRSNALQSKLPPATAEVRINRWSLATLSSGSVTIDSQSRVTFVTFNPLLIQLQLQETTGLLTGSFLHPASGKVTTLRGIVLQGDERAGGFFLDATSHDSGSISITTGN